MLQQLSTLDFLPLTVQFSHLFRIILYLVSVLSEFSLSFRSTLSLI